MEWAPGGRPASLPARLLLNVCNFWAELQILAERAVQVLCLIITLSQIHDGCFVSKVPALSLSHASVRRSVQARPAVTCGCLLHYAGTALRWLPGNPPGGAGRGGI